MRQCIKVAVAATLLLLVTSSHAAPAQSEPANEEEMDRQIGVMLQKLENANNLNPREKRAVNVLNGLLGGGGGGNFLNELNKGPTYSQLLSGGGAFNKGGLLTGILGSSSGTAIINRRPLISLSVAGGAGIIDEDPDLVALRFHVDSNEKYQRDNIPSTFEGPKAGVSAHLAIPLRGPLGLLIESLTPPNQNDAVENEYDDIENNGDEQGNGNNNSGFPEGSTRSLSSSGDGGQGNVGGSTGVSGGPYPAESPTPSETFEGKLRGIPDLEGNNTGSGGASASASVSTDGTTGGGDASAAAGGGSDSGSILSLVTPLLGSSSAGAAGGGDAAGASDGVSLGVGGAAGGANAIKSFIFRKLAQLLGSSSGSPQAG